MNAFNFCPLQISYSEIVLLWNNQELQSAVSVESKQVYLQNSTHVKLYRHGASKLQNQSMAASDQCPASKALHFFKIILKCTLIDGKLMIPRKFTNRYGGSLSNPVFLKLPDGTKWEVYWVKEDGEIWFQKGWKEFAEYYCLDHGDLVVFKFEEGNSEFEVIILDMSALEIDYASHAIQDVAVEVFDEMPKCKKKNSPKSPLKSLGPLKKMRTTTSVVLNNVEAKSTRQELEGQMGTSKLYSIKRAKSMAIRSRRNLRKNLSSPSEKTRALESVSSFRPKNPSRLPSQDGENPERGPHNNLTAVCPMTMNDVKGLYNPKKDYLTGKSSRSILTSPKADRRMQISVENAALLKASFFKSEYPYFWVVMQKSYLNNITYLHVPAKFAMEHLISKLDHRTITLQTTDGRVWHVKCIFRIVNNIQRTEFSIGWGKFSVDNDLQLHDVCVFKLINRSKVTFQVTIIRAATNPGGGVNGVGFEKSMDIQTETVSASNCGKATQSERLLKAQEEAKKFISENPFFKVNIAGSLLQRGSGGSRPSVPAVFLRKFMKSRVLDAMIQLRERSWPVKLHYYPHLPTGKLSAGWRLFAEESKLQLGDVCIFELIDTESAVLKVHIFRCHTQVM